MLNVELSLRLFNRPKSGLKTKNATGIQTPSPSAFAQYVNKA
jgi:hypothetical protein